MKTLLLICSAFLFLALSNLPMGYYTFLRILVTASAVAVVLTEFKGELTPTVITFGLIAILFNPIIPVHFNDKSIWMVIDLIAGILFAIKAFTIKTNENE